MFLSSKLSIVVVSVAALAASLNARPFPADVDVHSTTLEVDQVAPLSKQPNAEAFMVTVQRVDDIVDDGNHVLAERVSRVQLAFDVVDSKLMCNKVEVPVGLSNIQMQAVVAEFSGSKKQLKKVEKEFAVGLVSVEFDVQVAEAKRDGITVRQLLIAERIVELDGKTVEQTDAVQQIIEVYADGSFCLNPQPAKASAPTASTSAATVTDGGAEAAVSTMCNDYTSDFIDWFQSLSAPLQGTLVGVYAVFLAALVWATGVNVRSYLAKRRSESSMTAAYAPITFVSVPGATRKEKKMSAAASTVEEATVLYTAPEDSA